MAIHEHEVHIREDAPAQLDEVGKALLAAADHIREYGWGGPGCWGSPGEPRCIMGALSGTGLFDRAAHRLENSLGLDPANNLGVAGVFWNNAPGRTKEEVIEALERAAWGI